MAWATIHDHAITIPFSHASVYGPILLNTHKNSKMMIHCY
jgi:hypothetical protein